MMLKCDATDTWTHRRESGNSDLDFKWKFWKCTIFYDWFERYRLSVVYVRTVFEGFWLKNVKKHIFVGFSKQIWGYVRTLFLDNFDQKLLKVLFCQAFSTNICAKVKKAESLTCLLRKPAKTDFLTFFGYCDLV